MVFSPPIGAVYMHNKHVPILGKQLFRIHIETETRARLECRGYIQLTEPITFSSQTDDVVNVTLGPKLERMLHQLHTHIQYIRYDAVHDEAIARVKPPFMYPLNIHLYRVYDDKGNNPHAKKNSIGRWKRTLLQRLQRRFGVQCV